MNCVVGDLAITKPTGIPGGESYNYRFVEVAHAGPYHDLLGALWNIRPMGWVPSEVDLSPDGLFLYPDKFLRPIHDGDGKDETLEWLDVPAPKARELDGAEVLTGEAA